MEPANHGSPSHARFTVVGRSPVNVDVDGVIDAGAAQGFDAVVDWLVGSREVVVDLRGCTAMDGAGRDGLTYSVERLRRSGTSVSLKRPGAMSPRSDELVWTSPA